MTDMYAFPQGTYEDAVAMIGHGESAQVAAAPVSWAMIQAFAALVEDGNPAYWDEEAATELWGSVVAPPAMLQVWVLPPPWSPYGGGPGRLPLGARVPLPGTSTINVGTETTFHRPVPVGAVLSVTEQVLDVSEVKRTRLGPGHFVVTRGEYRDEQDRIVAVHTNTMLRFSPEAG